jgi:ribosomal-protein-alanine N-acetyltransferase
MRMEDVAEVAALENEIFGDPWSADSFLAEVERNPDIGYPIVLRSQEEIVAYAVAWFIVDEIHIGNIAVRPEHQGQGIGQAMLRSILVEGERRGMTYATLEVRPSNKRALALYERFAFRQIAVRKQYYRDNREDALVLSLELPHEGGVE